MALPLEGGPSTGAPPVSDSQLSQELYSLTRIRTLIMLGALLALATAFAACGSSSSSTSDVPPQQVLDQTFTAGNTIKSANLSLDLGVKIEGGSKAGNLDFSLSGPFQSQGVTKIPAFALTAKASGDFSGQGVNFEGGLTSTGDAAYISYGGTNYVVGDSMFKAFEANYEKSASSSQTAQSKAKSAELLKSLGITKPEDILTNLTNEGDADVEGTTTTHISGDLDINKAVDAIQKALAATGGLAGTSLPPAALDQLKSAITKAHFDVYSGNDDHLLRRFALDLAIEPPQGDVSSVDVTLDVTLGDVNQPQTITAPSNAKPLTDLLSQFGISPDQLGALGSLGAGVSSGSGSSPAPSSAQLDCLKQAKTQADFQKCVTQ
jgi:hypothetical protein